jgi:hypothetical protein
MGRVAHDASEDISSNSRLCVRLEGRPDHLLKFALNAPQFYPDTARWRKLGGGPRSHDGKNILYEDTAARETL